VPDLRQFKLTNDEEIICEVVEWNDETTDNILVRKALKIVAIDEKDQSMRYYTFKPWMMMSTDPLALHILNSYHIVSESAPSDAALGYFDEIITTMTEEGAEEIISLKDSDFEDHDLSQEIVH